MPVAAGNLKTASFAELWRGAPVFDNLRDPKLGGRCGACEFSKICGGCRCRAYATYGDYLAEDPACGYAPGAHGGAVIELPATVTFGLPVAWELAWDADARERLQAIPSFARGMVGKAVEAYARGRGDTAVRRGALARIWAVLAGVRAFLVGAFALVGAESRRMPTLGGGVPPSPAAAWLMALVAAVTAAMLARAAWSSEGAA